MYIKFYVHWWSIFRTIKERVGGNDEKFMSFFYHVYVAVFLQVFVFLQVHATGSLFNPTQSKTYLEETQWREHTVLNIYPSTSLCSGIVPRFTLSLYLHLYLFYILYIYVFIESLIHNLTTFQLRKYENESHNHCGILFLKSKKYYL
jgi:hypothetical protein